MRRIGPTFFIPTFALMIASAAFGGIIRGSFINRKWLNFWSELFVYLLVAFIALGYLAIPLYVE